jgi:hypothetical protein
MTRPRAGLPGWLAGAATGLALLAAMASGPAAAQPAASDTPTQTAATSPAPDPDPPATAVAPEPASELHGLSPLPGDAAVPLAWMPPGTDASPVPSEKIFPPQTIPLRFNHKLHVGELEQTCKVCHRAAYTSRAASDRLLPDPSKTCDNCHDVDHRDLGRVVAGAEPSGRCDYCHLGDGAGVDGRVARVELPAPSLRMNHQKHLDRNIGCPQCHGMIAELEKATRDQLPRMAGCFSCHAMSGAAAGEARGDCVTCHLTEPSGQLTTHFANGKLLPPQWLHGAQHTADWLARHKLVAGGNSRLCASCHQDRFCVDCHDGKVRPRAVHPNDWLSMHPQAARQDEPRCVSCHQLTTFCGDCHRRVGVARDAPSSVRAAARRFHPAPSEWTTAPRGPKHHAWEAQRNLNACVSCHSERDCATCHASKGLRGGGGINPHPPGFTSRCDLAFARNPRPCLVCHQASSPVLTPCR